MGMAIIGSQSMDDGAVALEALKFSGMWRRNSDGGWVIARDMFNTDVAPE